MTVIAGRYELLELLGSGGFGSVYKARQTDLQTIVAVKLLNPDLAPDAVAVRRFQAEAKALASLAHPAIPKVHRVEPLDTGGLFVAMDYIDGMGLEALLRQRGKLPVGEAVRIFVAVADAIEHAHSKGIVHRDLKPSNIMISAERVFVLDFGIAKHLQVDDKLTQTGALVGTVRYMSPEQASGLEVGPQSDIYSLACVLYESLTGAPLFDSDSPVEMLMRHVEETLPSLDTPELRPLAGVLTKALAKNPKERFESMAAFAYALKAPDTVRAQTRRLRRPESLRALAAVVIGTVSVTSLMVWLASAQCLALTKQDIEDRLTNWRPAVSQNELEKIVLAVERRSVDMPPAHAVEKLRDAEAQAFGEKNFAQAILFGKAKVEIARRFALSRWDNLLRVTRNVIMRDLDAAAAAEYVRVVVADEEAKGKLQTTEGVSALRQYYEALEMAYAQPEARAKVLAKEIAIATYETSPYYFSVARVDECIALESAKEIGKARLRALDFIDKYGDRNVCKLFMPWMLFFVAQGEASDVRKRDVEWKSYQAGIPVLDHERVIHQDQDVDGSLAEVPAMGAMSAISKTIEFAQKNYAGETKQKALAMWKDWSSRAFVQKNYSAEINRLEQGIDALTQVRHE